MGRHVILTDQAPQPAAEAAYSQGIISTGPQVYFKKQEGTGSGSITDQAAGLFDRFGELLSTAGLSYGDVAKVKLEVADMDEYGNVNVVYRERFSKDPPARALVQANLPDGVLITMECQAGVKDRTQRSDGSVWNYSIAMGKVAGYFAGQIGLPLTGPPLVEGLDEQAGLSQSHVLALLKEAGMVPQNVCYVNVYVTQNEHRNVGHNVIRGIRPDMVSGNVLVVPRLPLDALIEIEVRATANEISPEAMEKYRIEP